MAKFTLHSNKNGFTGFQEDGRFPNNTALAELADGLSFLLYALNGTAEEQLGTDNQEALDSAIAYLQAGTEALEELKL